MWRKLLVLLLGLLILGMGVTKTSNTTNIAGPDFPTSKLNLPTYYIGSPEVGVIVQKAGFTKVTILDDFKTLPKEKGVIIISRGLNEREINLLDKALKNGFIIVAIGEDALNQVKQTLLKMKAISVDFYYSDSGGKLVRTKVYAYKIMKKLPNGRYGVYIKGYAGNVTPEMLKTAAFEAVSAEGS